MIQNVFLNNIIRTSSQKFWGATNRQRTMTPKFVRLKVDYVFTWQVSIFLVFTHPTTTTNRTRFLCQQGPAHVTFPQYLSGVGPVLILPVLQTRTPVQ